ncbi:MAG: PEGA domain-containing protein, partial [Pseudomonadota bacterium]|nr:PEGA domain-containing protein [Pseudomonadota bacterium]
LAAPPALAPRGLAPAAAPPAALPPAANDEPVVAAPVVAPPVEAAPAPAEVAPPPMLVAAAAALPPPPAPTDLDADAMSDIASALGAPAVAGSAAPMPAAPMPAQMPATSAPAPVTFHKPLPKESEDAKATLPMYTAYPEEAPPSRSILDDEPTRKKVAGAGIGVALLGVLALGAFLIVAAVGLWWTMSNGGESTKPLLDTPPVAASKVLPAAAAPAPVVPVPVAPVPVADGGTDVLPGQPVVPTPPAPAATVAATPPTTTVAAVSKPPPATTTPRATNTAGATVSPPKSTPASTPTGPRSTPTPVTADAGTSNVTSDNVWGTPTAPTSGFLRIVTDPDGATVYVNDAAKGKTPVTIELPYGAHQVRVVRAGYKTEVRDVNIRVRELTVPFNLKPEVVTGQVNVYGPDGFRVVVDGHDMGPMPVTVQVSEGVRQFKLVGSDGSTCNLPKEIKFKAAGRPETITLACP